MNSHLPLPTRSALAASAFAATLLVLPAEQARASSHIVDVVWGSNGRFEHAAPVAAGKIVELCVKLDVGDKVKWSFETAVPMDFNIHYHVGKETAFPARQSQVSKGSDVLQAAAKEHYCWMWSNKSSGEAMVRATLQR